MILIVDDDNAVRSSLLFMLKRAGYQAKAVPGPRDAMQEVRTEAPDLILMDMNFSLSTSGEEGLTLLKALEQCCFAATHRNSLATQCSCRADCRRAFF